MHGNIYTKDADMPGPVISKFPYIYEIEPTNACPYRCYMCPRGQGKMNRQVGFMPVGLFRKILEQIPLQQRILRLHHFGEPLLHPDIAEFVRLARSSGFLPLLSLNPAGLTEELIRRLIENGAGIVCFSLDSLDSQQLHAIRGITKTAAYCLNMIDRFIHLSRKASFPIFKVIQMVSLTANKAEQKSFLSLKENYPEDDVYVYVSDNYGFGDLGIVNETCKEGADRIISNGSPCSAPFDDIVILWNGDVVLCCNDYDGCNIIGNIHEDTIENLWKGAKIEDIRNAFLQRAVTGLSLCNKCYLAPHKFPYTRYSFQKRGYTEESHILELFRASNKSDYAR